MPETTTRAEVFGRALRHLRRSRQLFFSLISADDQQSPLVKNLMDQFSSVQSDVRGYGYFLLRLYVNAQGEVEDVDARKGGGRKNRQRQPDDHLEWR
jgi:hypothetical protein